MRVVIEDICKEYIDHRGRKVSALEGINLTLQENELVALVGPSGCGKSTLLNLVGGLLRPTSGRIYVEGLEQDRDPNISVVFQEIGLFPWRTVYQNVMFGIEEQGADAAASRELVNHYISLVGLDGFDNTFPHQLSGGMRQRAAIARALVAKPDMLLMDEPFSALDAQTRTLMQEELLRIWSATRLTTLYVTHNIQEAVYLADRIVVLSRRPGRITTVVKVDLPRIGRDMAVHAAKFGEYVETIWGLIRNDAQAALAEGEEA